MLIIFLQNFTKFGIIANMVAVELKSVSFSYGKSKKALNNINLTINEGERVTILGHNGSGKSTLAKMLNGLLIPSEGEVKIFGLTSSEKTNLPEIRKTAGMVFQNPDNQAVATIVEDDIAFGPENLGLNREEIASRIDFALKVTEMEDFRKKTFSRLSGGQKQRIAIAGILAMKPKILILDESTSMLDPKGRKEVMTIAEKLRQEENMTVICITHYMDEAIGSDKVVVLSQGEIIKVGTPKEVFADTPILQRAGLTTTRSAKLSQSLAYNGFNIELCHDKSMLKQALIPLVKKGKYSQKISSPASEINARKGKTIISCKDLSFVYNPKSKFPSVALDKVTLDICEGEFIGVIGHTGSGKSTFIQHINRLINAQSGTLTVDGLNLCPSSRKEKKQLKKSLQQLRKKVGMVFQYPENQLFAETVYADIAFGIKNFMPNLDQTTTEVMVKTALERVGLDFEQIKDKSPFELSGGQKRRVAIAGVIVTNPEVLILDEPLAGLDPQGKVELMALLKSLFNTATKTIILISHDMDEVCEACSRIIVFDNGKIALDDTPKSVFSQVDKLKELRLDSPLVADMVDTLAQSGCLVDCDLTTQGFINAVSGEVENG